MQIDAMCRSVRFCDLLPADTQSNTMPPPLRQAYYLKAHSGRKLTWQTNMGSADLKATFGSKRHELNVSTYQVQHTASVCLCISLSSRAASGHMCRKQCGHFRCMIAAGVHSDAVQRVGDPVLRGRVSGDRHSPTRAQAQPAVACLRQGRLQQINVLHVLLL